MKILIVLGNIIYCLFKLAYPSGGKIKIWKVKMIKNKAMKNLRDLFVKIMAIFLLKSARIIK